ncbi:hypothetical protein DPMN_092541 [Dreissena polymorpha]|uniref:Uncharacterized protein n=1 Tax=Dreissena polymorpha TaxID=45954 RepID=A0A9D4L280_DREPO|nr:hypothetical protein DPMN_092541 [Dreissena polymorpha]
MGSEDYQRLKRSRSAYQALLTKTYRELEVQMSSQENAESVTALNDKLVDGKCMTKFLNAANLMKKSHTKIVLALV